MIRALCLGCKLVLHIRCPCFFKTPTYAPTLYADAETLQQQNRKLHVSAHLQGMVRRSELATHATRHDRASAHGFGPYGASL